MRPVKAIYKAEYEPIADLVTYRAMPTEKVPMNSLDPFLLLNHHGRQQYPPGNSGLPFGPHPHRGFETVTFILEGDLTHKDSSGAASVIKAGGVQWMTAGSGLIHAEVSSTEFKRTGGALEILQLWLNLPARHKMTAPAYKGLQEAEIPVAKWDGGNVEAQIISGNWQGVQGAFQPLTDIHLAVMQLHAGAKLQLNVPALQSILFYVIKGTVQVNNKEVHSHHLVQFENRGERLEIAATEKALLLIGHATPFAESFVAHGPFVMNSREEIMQAYDDYQKGVFGTADALLEED